MVGFRTPEIEDRIVDPVTGAELEPGQEGEVCITGPTVMAFVISKAGETFTAEEVAAFARGRITNFKVPKYVEIVESFPLTGSGKVQTFKQRAYAVERCGLKEPACA